ncbi:rhamnulokinase [Butyrivibrio fibrisolvens]|uniref:Rhamnulokinase n=2 Tax=Butyrivibrio fibrisolvens TaxID=831 RepID=A0A1H9LT79_BUTFI|nr:rhamnulokinase [Butyrivibrio fibrisolvens]
MVQAPYDVIISIRSGQIINIVLDNAKFGIIQQFFGIRFIGIIQKESMPTYWSNINLLFRTILKIWEIAMGLNHLAVDIGASSGRHIIGRVDNGIMKLQEVYRFENGVSEKNDHLCWDINLLYQNIIDGIRECRNQNLTPDTMGIDTWGVDFVLLDSDGEILGDTVAYRDERTDGIRQELEDKGILSFDDLYSKTGIQYQKFNTIYQLVALQKEHPEYMEQAESFLMIPDYLNYKLTGIKSNEYTNASTTALVDAKTCDWDYELIEKLGLPKKIFGKLSKPGTKLGRFTQEVRNYVGFDLDVILPATHDTGSAYLAVPARDDKAVFLSSGTWSLMGVENKESITNGESKEANFTNEGGYNNTYRYLKNIMGLWMIQSVRREIGEITGTKPSFPELIEAAKQAKDVDVVLDVDDARFLAPKSMIEEIKKACEDAGRPLACTNEDYHYGKELLDREKDSKKLSDIDKSGKDNPDVKKSEASDTPGSLPAGTGEVMAVIYNSLSDDYRRTVETLEKLTGNKYTSINIVGGGSQDMYLNKRTAQATGLPVFAGPTEGTALGNLIVQFICSGEYKNLQEARDAIKKSFDIKCIED